MRECKVSGIEESEEEGQSENGNEDSSTRGRKGGTQRKYETLNSERRTGVDLAGVL